MCTLHPVQNVCGPFVNGCLLLRKEAGHLVKADGHVWVARAERCDMTGALEP